MVSSNQLENIDEVKILLPEKKCENLFFFKTTIIQTQDNKTLETTIARKVAVRFSGLEDNLWCFQIICLKQDIEAKHIGSSTIKQLRDTIFDEVQVHVNQNGTILAVLNIKEIQHNWQVIKNELIEKHKGNVLEDFFNKTDELLEKKERILKFVSSKEMYGLYFNSCWGYHDLRKPRFEELIINIEKRIQKDRHSQHLQKKYTHDAQLIIKKETEEQKQLSRFTYKNNKLEEAFLEIKAKNTNSIYSIVCLKS